MQSSRTFSLIAFFAVLILGACEKVPLTAPSESTITITLSRTSVALNDTIDVIATVIESSGTPVHNGTVVTFTGPLGSFDPIEATTVGGIARTKFKGTTSGTGKISAFSGGATVESGDIRVGSAAAERVTVRTEPATLPANGGTVQVIANVQDASGNALPNAAVNFTVDNGNLSANTAFTDANGEARVSLSTTRTTKVDANVAGKNATQFTLTALPAPTVTITGCTANPVVGAAATCTFTPTPGAGGSAIQNVTVNWGDGTGDENLGPITGATTKSHVYNRADTFTVSAAATDSAGQTGRASASLVVGRSIPTISITPSTQTTTAGTAATFTVTSSAPAGSPPITNVTIDFGDGTSRNLGAVSGSTSVSKTYTSPGQYTATATARDSAGTQNSSSASVTVNPSAGPQVQLTQNGTLSGGCGSFSVTFTPPPGATIASGRVNREGDNRELYNGTTSSTFAACGLAANDILTARATDSIGGSNSAQLLVR